MLDGINKLCEQCTQECKQFKQLKVIYCPNYSSNQANTKQGVPLHRGNYDL